MTCELMINTGNTIALAADSALTIGENVINGTKKIFEISNRPPIGLMINGVLEIGGQYIKTIVGEYRQTLDMKQTNTPISVMNDFIDFTEKFVIDKGEYSENIFKDEIKYFEETIDFEIKNSELDPKGTLEELLENSDLTFYNLLKENNSLDLMNKELFSNIIKKYFEDEDEEEIVKLLRKNYTINIEDTNIIVAGFDTKNTHPSFSSYRIFGVINDKLLYSKDLEEINVKETFIIPFAQSEIIDNFIYGITNNMLEHIRNNMENLFNIIQIYISSNLKNNSEIDDKTLKIIKRELEKIKEIIDNDIEFYLSKIKEENDLSNINMLFLLKYADESILIKISKILIEMTGLKFELGDIMPIVGGKTQIVLMSKDEGFKQYNE